MKRISKAATVSTAIIALGMVGLAPATAASFESANAVASVAVDPDTKDAVAEVRTDLDQVLPQAVGQIKDGAKQLDASMEKLETAVRFNATTIFDLDSIPARADLATDVVDAIMFATTQLVDKVDKAHQDIAIAITKAAIQVANPFASIAQIEAAGQALRDMKDKVMQYPNLTLEDRATVYTRSKLDRAIWQVRFTRDREILGKVPFRVYHNLNRAITKAVGVQLRISSKVSDINKAIEDVNAALKVAQDSLSSE